MANSAYHNITGMEDLSKNLRGLSDDMRLRVIAIAVKRGARPVLRAAKRHAGKSKRTGALQKSLTSVTRQYKQQATAIEVVGPDRNYYADGKKLGKGASRAGADRPTKYAHLVEYGHYSTAGTGRKVSVSKGTSRRKGTFVENSFVRGQPFLRPAINESKAAVRSEMEAVVSAAVKRYTK